jgi:hypothetical protein
MHICMYFRATRVFGRWYLFLCRPHSLPALASCWMVFLNPAGDFDWLDRYRHGSAKDRTAPSLLAAPWSKPGSLRVEVSVLVNFTFIIPNANLGRDTGNTATTTCYPTRVGFRQCCIARRLASAAPTSH